jgi:small conductance mechanosensitive channel
MKEQNFFEPITGKFTEWGGKFIDIFPYFVLALIVIIFSFFIARISKKIILKIFERFSTSKAVSKLIANIIVVIIFIGGVIVALGILKLDKTVTSLLAGAGIIGLALGIAFQDLVSNIISGVLIAIRKPFNIGDLIETNGIFGEVLDIRLRTTELENRNGQIVFIPSREVLQKPLTNFTMTGKRRIVLNVGISYGEDLERVRDITLEAVKTIPDVLESERIEFFYKEFGDSSINFIVRFWIKFTKQREYRKAVSDAIIAVKAAFNKNDITIPFPIRTLDFGIKGGEKLSENIEMINVKRLTDKE